MSMRKQNAEKLGLVKFSCKCFLVVSLFYRTVSLIVISIEKDTDVSQCLSDKDVCELITKSEKNCTCSIIGSIHDKRRF